MSLIINELLFFVVNSVKKCFNEQWNGDKKNSTIFFNFPVQGKPGVGADGGKSTQISTSIFRCRKNEVFH